MKAKQAIKYVFPIILALLLLNSIIFLTSITQVNATFTGSEFCLDSSFEGQSSFTPISVPWYCYVGNFSRSTAQAHSGTYSLVMVYQGGAGCAIHQDVPLLDTDLLYNFSFYVKTLSSSPVVMHVDFWYSDGSYSGDDINGIVSSMNWVNVGSTISFDSGKLLVGYSFHMVTVTSDLTFVDDVSLKGQTGLVPSFAFSLVPAPAVMTWQSFSANQGVAYTFLGYVYDAGVLSGDGTFNVSSSMGFASGIINDGLFSYSINPRSVQVANSSETFIIGVNATDIGSFYVHIYATWLGTGEAGPFDLISPEIMQFLNLLYVFIVIFAPPLIISILVRKVKGDAMVGFIAGLALSVVAGIITNIVPLWGLFIMTLVLAYSIFAKVKEK
jgi:hypothetical protein